MPEWNELALGEVLTLQRGFDLPKRLRKDGPYPVVSSSGVTGWHDEFKVEPPGIVIGRYGTLGSVHWVAEKFWPLNTSLWVKDFKGNDPKFLSYLLQTVVVDGSAASAVPGVNRNHLHTKRVLLPTVREQKQIAAVLSTFEELIEINEQRIEVLEILTRSLYQQWFLHYRFPGYLHDRQDIGEDKLPKGWSVGHLAEFAEVVVEGVAPSDFDFDEPYVGLEHIPRRSTTLRHWGRLDAVKSRKLRFQEGDTLFAKIRPNLHKVAWAPCAGVTSSDTLVFRPVKDEGFGAFVNAILSSDQVVAEAAATANGTKMPRANPEVLLDYEIPVPKRSLLLSFERVVSRWLKWSAELVAVNAQLTATRDLLLPRLVSGQLDISDIDLGVLTPAGPE